MTRRWLTSTGWVIAAGTTALLGVLAARADQQASGATVSRTALDVTVGVAFVIVGAAMPPDQRSRAGMGAVGASWLLGSFVPSARLMHQACLIVVLALFPTGRRHNRVGWVSLLGAVPVALLLVPQAGVAGLFLAVAVYQFPRLRVDAAAAWYPVAAAAALASVLGGAWFAARSDRAAFDPSGVLLIYELVLLGVATGFAIAARTVAAGRRHLADTVLADSRLVGLEGLSAVLGDALGDQSLAVYRWEATQNRYVDHRGRSTADPRATAWWFPVDDGPAPLGVVAHRSAALTDPTTAAAVSTAVKLYLVNLQRQRELEDQLDELESARARFAAAADRQRAATAAKLRSLVVSELEITVAALGANGCSFGSAEAADATAVVMHELGVAAEEIVALVAGVPTANLGGGRLREAVEAMGQRCPLPVTVTAGTGVAASPDIETTLYYVCSEALANAVKHAAATRLDITMTEDGASIAVEVFDDGRGGADPEGTGLLGLADRVAARGGRLWVVSPPGAGTTITARVPRSESDGDQAIFCQGSSTKPV